MHLCIKLLKCMVLLRDNVASAHNLFQVTNLFILIESASGMRISLDYQPIEVNTGVATESYATECNCMHGKSYLNTEFCRKQSI